MLTIQTATYGSAKCSKEFCRVVLTEESPSVHRFVETPDGTLEYRVGVGKWSEVDVRALRLLVRGVIQSAKSHQIEKLALELSPALFPKLASESTSWFYSTVTENVLMAGYEYTRYKSKEDKKKPLREVLLCGVDSKEAAAGIARGRVVAEFVNKARDIANTSGHDLSPTQFGEEAKKLLKHKSITVKVLGESEIKKLNMGALLAVGQGTRSETKFIVAEYWGAGKPTGKKVASEKAPIVLIGKGITYDTGGLNVKPSGAMHDMHLDMSGGSSVLAALGAAAALQIKKNIVVLVPAAENAISDEAMRAGDILTSMSGRTIEVIHTDAEGRLILADALTYSERYAPRAIIDVATLTGAALVALGQHASAVMTKDDALRATLSTLGERSGDYVWPLPLWDEYKQHIKSARADVSNINPTFAKWGGCIEGGTFLSYFAPREVPWAHIDIAPRMDSIPSDKLAKGATGEPVRLLVQFLESY